MLETTYDSPLVPMANAHATRGLAQGIDGHQLVQWLTVQASDMTCTLQQGVRTFLTQTNTPPLLLRGHADELARLKAQLQCQKKSKHKMKTMLHNQTLAIHAFQHKWLMAGNEAQTFIQRTKSQPENACLMCDDCNRAL